MKRLFPIIGLISMLSTAFAVTPNDQCQKIISLSPTATDTLLSLGLENYIQAGTRYDRLPKNSKIGQVGGMLDPNYEAITLLDPTIIFAELTEDSPQVRKLRTLNFNTTLIDFTSLEAIDQAIKQIGQICGIEAIANAKSQALHEAIKDHQLQDQSQNVLIFYTYEGDDYISQLPERATGKSFHQDILEAIGGHNAYQGALNAPILSQESILMLNPDKILLLGGDQTGELNPDRSLTIQRIHPNWPNLQSLSAIQSNNVYHIQGEAAFIASPDAVIATLKSLYSALSQQSKNHTRIK